MSYIWENYSVNKKYNLAKKSFSPYTEVMCSDYDNVKVNILFRFCGIYNMISEEEVDDDFYNLLFHLLANVDFYTGMTQKDIMMLKIKEEIEKYGIEKSFFENLMQEHQYILLSYLYIREHEKNRYCRFFDFLTEVFDLKLYYSEFLKRYIVCMKCEENSLFMGKKEYTAGQLYNLAKDLFCDFWITVEVYWNMSIGIIGDYIEVGNTLII